MYNEDSHLHPAVDERVGYGLWQAFFCALALPALVLLAHPYAEMGVNDDWGYIWIARDLARTGHIHYDGWPTSILGPQLYWGAAFIRAFGFSFTTLRFSILAIAAVLVFVIHRLFTRCGISNRNASLATLTLAVSPLFFSLSFSFMSDIGGLLGIVLCAYACVRALQSSSENNAAWWLLFAAVSNVALGSVRQIAWLGLLVMLPSATWLLRKSNKLVLTGIVLWLIGSGSVVGLTLWFGRQPYTLPEALLAGVSGSHWIAHQVLLLTRSILLLCTLLLPIALSFVHYKERKSRSAIRTSILAIFAGTAGVLTVLALYLNSAHHSLRMITPFSNNLITARGMVDLPDLLGHRSDIVPVWVRIVLLALVAAGASSVIMSLTSRRPPGSGARNLFTLPNYDFAVLFGPFTLGYLALLVTRANLYDRYLLPLLMIATIALVRLYERHVRSDLRSITVIGIVAVAVFSVTTMHDLFATSRARISAAESLQAAGIPRKDFRAGFEYDAWTQLEIAGYVNDPRIRIPAGAYQPSDTTTEDSDACRYWFTEETPGIHARYGLAYEPHPCDKSLLNSTVRYRTWIPPRDHSLYIVSFH